MKKRKKLRTVSVTEHDCRPSTSLRHLQRDEAERLGREQQVVVAAAPIRRREGDGDEPEVREDQVEEKDVARVHGEEEGQGVECGRQDSLCPIRVSDLDASNEKQHYATTYNDKFIDDVVTAPALGDEVGQDAHHDHRRDPDEGAARERKG